LKRGKFITIEGGEGAGKSTNILYIKELLASYGLRCMVTREPGGTPLSEEIRRLLLERREEKIDSLAELLLVFSARAQHLNNKIMPALNNGIWVVSDRFTDATYAYQGAGRGLDVTAVALLENLVQKTFRPDCTMILDLPVETGMQRASQRGELDRFEVEKNDFFNRVRQCYLQRAMLDKTQYHVIDASETLERVQISIKSVIECLIN